MATAKLARLAEANDSSQPFQSQTCSFHFMQECYCLKEFTDRLKKRFGEQGEEKTGDTEDEWQKLTDESTGRVTYYNTRTQETSTTKPESAHDKFVRSLRTKFKILTGLFQILNQVWFSSSLQLVLLSSLLG